MSRRKSLSEPTQAERDLAYDLERTGDHNSIAYALADQRAKYEALAYEFANPAVPYDNALIKASYEIAAGRIREVSRG